MQLWPHNKHPRPEHLAAQTRRAGPVSAAQPASWHLGSLSRPACGAAACCCLRPPLPSTGTDGPGQASRHGQAASTVHEAEDPIPDLGGMWRACRALPCAGARSQRPSASDSHRVAPRGGLGRGAHIRVRRGALRSPYTIHRISCPSPPKPTSFRRMLFRAPGRHSDGPPRLHRDLFPRPRTPATQVT